MMVPMNHFLGHGEVLKARVSLEWRSVWTRLLIDQGSEGDLLEDSPESLELPNKTKQIEEARELHSMSTSTTAGCPGKVIVTAAVRSWLLKEVLLLNECD